MNLNNNLAFIFPGQGSQAVGMLETFAGEQIVKQTLEEANDSLNEDIYDVIANGSAEKLNSTIYTQPAILATSVAIYRLWTQKTNILPSLVAGHSLGEYSALVATGSLAFSDAIKLVRFRAKVMQEAVPAGVGSMAAIIGLEADKIRQICQEITQQKTFGSVEVANYNSREQTVIAGHKEALEQACNALKQSGAKRALPLPVSAPFHSSLLSPASLELEQYLKDVTINPIQDIKYINNVDVAMPVDSANIKQALVKQVSSSVRWVETIELMLSNNITNFVECGPAKVLQGLVKRILPSDSAKSNDFNILGADNLDTLLSSIESLNNINTLVE
ncbi:MAG: hypothetical protein RLZZ210_1439 [Pseudomonadota bacterium]